MSALNLVLDADGKFPHLAEKPQRAVESITITGLEGGTRDGQPSVGILIELADGSYVLPQTTLKLFLTVADALKAKYGDPRQRGVPE
jgi:hypothetical protein